MPSSTSSYHYFPSAINYCDLHCLNMKGSFLTWTNSWGQLDPRDHVEAQLDRALCSKDWLSH